MKNTLIPLDIAFINEEGIIESIKELDPQNPIPVYPDGEIRYAIEVNRGWFAENGIEVGDIILEDTEETEIDLTEVKDKKGKGSGTKDACYHKVKSRYSVWPSAYASGALVKCRKVGAANWGNSRKEEVEYVNEGNKNVEAPSMKYIKSHGMSDETFVNTYKKTFSKDPKDQKVDKDGYSTQNKFTAELARRQYNTGKDFSGNPLYKKKETKKEHYDWRQDLDEKCWKGYEKKGMKTMFGKRYPNCVKKSKKKK